MTQPGSPSATASPSHPMVLGREHTALVVIDVQERLFPAMDSDHREEVMRNLKVLAATAQRLELPTLATEQYPKGLGHTLPEMKAALPTGLDADREGGVLVLGGRGVPEPPDRERRRQVLLGGIEAHVCVLMSALDLLAAGYGVHIVADAVTSRTQANWRLAMAQLRQAGAVVTTTETVALPAAAPGRFRRLPGARAPDSLMSRYFDVRNTVLLVVGYGILPEEEDRPDRLRAEARDHSRAARDAADRSAVVVTDMWMLNQEMAELFPAIAIGGPAVNAFTAQVYEDLPLAFTPGSAGLHPDGPGTGQAGRALGNGPAHDTVRRRSCS